MIETFRSYTRDHSVLALLAVSLHQPSFHWQSTLPSLFSSIAPRSKRHEVEIRVPLSTLSYGNHRHRLSNSTKQIGRDKQRDHRTMHLYMR
ncbi:hypothetical protein U1Q18_020997 [Sarracenia purpurea var. burkii]